MQLDEKIYTTLMSLHLIWSYSQEPVSLAQRLETTGLSQSKGNKIHLPAPPKLTH